MLELTEEMEETVPDFTLQAHLREVPREVGRRLREALGVSVQEQLEWRNEWQAWRRWREATESVGALVFQFPKVSLEQVRGVSLLKFPLPAIDINGKESAPGARIFTLLHESTHITLAAGNEEKAALNESADAYVIALAKHRDWVVVSQETSAQEKHRPHQSYFIPDVCRDLGIPCVNLLGMMRREKWVF